MKAANKAALRPDYVRRNVRGMKTLRLGLGIRAISVSRATGVAPSHLTRYERYGRLPLRRNYNRLAEYFGWEAWQ